jgi:hypothetical protein
MIEAPRRRLDDLFPAGRWILTPEGEGQHEGA